MSKNGTPIVVSVEQALSMSYATLRFKHHGWRVIRVENTPVKGLRSKGDPNRYIGRNIGAGEDRHSYYVAPNVGKESIVIDLKTEEGQDVLHRMVRELPADVFCSNTMPARHADLGFDYETMRKQKEDIIWVSISAMGLRYPNVPGYDPMVQAMCGFMDLTGEQDGPPMQCGPPLSDLKAGDEAYAQVMMALWERAEKGTGKQIDISMAQGAISWLHTFMPMLDMDSPPEELKRAGNAHRQFIPVNAYETADGYIYIAVGSDVQWKRFAGQPMFSELADEQYLTNEGRRADKANLFARIGAVTKRHSYDDISQILAEAKIPHSRITPVEELPQLPFVKETGLETVAPDGRVVRLPGPAVHSEYLDTVDRKLPFAPSYGEHTEHIMHEIGMRDDEINALRDKGVVV